MGNAKFSRFLEKRRVFVYLQIYEKKKKFKRDYTIFVSNQITGKKEMKIFPDPIDCHKVAFDFFSP